MTRPVVSETTERLYRSLPAVYRAGDAAQADGPDGYPLLRFLGVALDTGLARVDQLLDRLLPIIPQPLGNPAAQQGGPLAGDGLAGEGLAGGPAEVSVFSSGVYVDGVPALADPAAADDYWLPWLGQFIGVRLADALDEVARRAAVASAQSGFRVGTRPAVIAAAASALTGTKYVRVLPHYVPSGGIAVPGGVFDLLLITRPSETPDTGAVVAAIIAAGAKGAAVRVQVLAYVSSWDQEETLLPTWAAEEDASTDGDGMTWQQLEELGATG